MTCGLHRGHPTAASWRGDHGEHPSRNTGHHDTQPPREGHHEQLTAAAPAAAEPLRSMTDGARVGPVIRSGPSGYQTSHDPLCPMLPEVLGDRVRPGGALRVGSARWSVRRCSPWTRCLGIIRLINWVAVGPVAGLSRCSGPGGTTVRCTARRLCASAGSMEVLLSLLADE